MSFLLDTNICSAHLKRPAGLMHRFLQHSGRLHIPTIVLGELYSWAFHRKDPSQAIPRIENDLLTDALVDDPLSDTIMEEARQDRKNDSRRDRPERSSC
jgi:tRNA(fMet)-specific endonuclease VapC